MTVLDSLHWWPAIHEAGHAVAATVRGLEVGAVAIILMNWTYLILVGR